jgi:hypothetical protein
MKGLVTCIAGGLLILGLFVLIRDTGPEIEPALFRRLEKSALPEEGDKLQLSDRVSLVREVPVHAQGMGAAAFNFIDPEGAGVQGITLTIFRGVLEEPLEDKPHGVKVPKRRFVNGISDSEGLVDFRDLVPGEYRWVLDSEGNLFSKDSGVITIVENTTTAETILVGTGTVVVGRVPVFNSLEAAHLRLFKKGNGADSEEPGGGVYASMDGTFMVPCTPGLGYISAFWPETNNTYCIAEKSFEIKEGVNDIGTLNLSSNQYEVKVAFALNGERVERDQLFEEGPFSAVLSIESLNDNSFGTKAWVLLDEDPVLLGLWEGEWYVALLPKNRFPSTRNGMILPSQEPSQRLFSSSEGGVIELVYEVLRPLETQFNIVWSGEPFQAEIMFLIQGGGLNDLKTFDARSHEVSSLGLSAGTYNYLLIPHYAMGERTNAVSSGVLEITGEPVFIDVKPGVVLCGNTRGGQRIKATIDGWEGIYPFRLTAEDDGSWEIPGIPLDSTITFDEGGELYTGTSPEKRFTF